MTLVFSPPAPISRTDIDTFAVLSSSPKLQSGTPPEWLARAQAAACATGFYNDKDGTCLDDEVTARIAEEGAYTNLHNCAALAIDDGEGGTITEYRCWSDGPKQETLIEATSYTPGIGSDDDEGDIDEGDIQTFGDVVDKTDDAAKDSGYSTGTLLLGAAAVLGVGVLAWSMMKPAAGYQANPIDVSDDVQTLAAQLKATGDDREKSFLAISTIDGWMSDGRFDEVNQLLGVLSPFELTPSTTLAVLSITYHGKDQGLSHREAFFNQAWDVLSEQLGAERTKKLLANRR